MEQFKIEWYYGTARNDYFAALGQVEHGISDERGRPVGHSIAIREVSPDDYYKLTASGAKFCVNTHITRYKTNFGALQSWKPLKAQTIEEAKAEVQALVTASIGPKTVKAMQKRLNKFTLKQFNNFLGDGSK